MSSFCSTLIIICLTFLIIGDVDSSDDRRERLCIPATSNPTLPENGPYACPKHYGILVDEIHMTAASLDDECETDDSSEDAIPENLNHFKGEGSDDIELLLHHACTGKRQCVLLSSLPSPISIPNSPGVYKTYIIMHTCVRVSQDEKDNATLFDITEDINAQVTVTESILVIRSIIPYDRQCVVTAANKSIMVDPLWISYNELAEKWYACFKASNVSRYGSVFDVDCNEEGVRKIFQHNRDSYTNSAKFYVTGERGLTWIRVSALPPYEIKCYARRSDSPYQTDEQHQLCIPSAPTPTPEEIVTPDACKYDDGILVTGIQMTRDMRDVYCDGPSKSPTVKINHQQIELTLKQACNGKRRCSIKPGYLSSQIPIPTSSKKVYKTYLLTYTCQPVTHASDSDINNQAVYNMANDFTVTVPKRAFTTLVFKSQTRFSRECVFNAPDGMIYLEMLWTSFDQHDKRWLACVQFFERNVTSSKFELGCNTTTVTKAFPVNSYSFNDVANVRMEGESGFVWIKASADANRKYVLTCRPKQTVPFFTGDEHHQKLCIPSAPTLEEFVTHDVCQCDDGILVTGIHMTRDKRDVCCGDPSNSPAVEINHQQIKLTLKQACNGKRRCSIKPGYLSSQIPMSTNEKVYKTYLLTYVCQPVTHASDSDINNQAVYDMANDFTVTVPKRLFSTLVFKSRTRFSRECVFNAPDGMIYLEMLWASFDQHDKRWLACVQFFERNVTSSKFELGCNKTTVTKAFRKNSYSFNDVANVRMEGESGFVWIQASAVNTTSGADLKYELTCRPKQTDPLVKTKNKKNQTDPLVTGDNTDSSASTTIAVTSTLAALATIIAICLAIYICYILKCSGYQRRIVSVHLERQLTQRQQEGQHPRVQSNRERSRREHQQPQQPNGETPYDMYTYMDVNDAKGTPTPQTERPPVAVPTMPPSNNNSYCSTKVTEGAYSDSYTFVQASNTAEGEYNQFGASNQTASRAGGDMYDTGPSGEYSHFDDVNKKTQIVGNLYDG